MMEEKVMPNEPVHNEEERADRLLNALAPGPLDQPQLRRAYRQFQITVENKGEPMHNFKSNPKLKRIALPVMAALLIAGLLAIPQVRALASNFLSLFRVEKFLLISVDEERAEQIANAISDESAYFDHEYLLEAGDPTEVATLAEAGAQVGFVPLTPDSGYGEVSDVYVRGAETVRVVPHVQAIRDLYTALNLDPNLIPENIDGQPFDIAIGASVMSSYGSVDGGNNVHGVVQAPAPTVTAPEGADIRKLGEAMLQLLGMSPEEAARISESIDWTTTLVVPVPAANASAIQEITVRGKTGLMFEGEPVQTEDGEWIPATSVLMWQENGFIFVVNGSGATDALIFAESLK
jgi:hypothetical protein